MTDTEYRGEKIISVLTPSRLHYFWAYLLGVLFLVAFWGIIIIILVELYRNGNKYYITEKKVYHLYKFLSRTETSASFDKIQDVQLRQELFDRMFGIGSLYINTAGSNKIEIKITGIKNPDETKTTIDRMITK